MVENHRLLNSPISNDDNTIDINQIDEHEPLLSPMPDKSLINNSTSMDAAVKMVQPIVDIIFNAFEDQLKTIQPPVLNSTTDSSRVFPPMMIPCFPLTSPTRPIVLHAVNFNIQLTAKEPTIKSIEEPNSSELQTNVRLNENLQSISFSGLKEKVISYILSNNLITDHQTEDGNDETSRKLKRIVQLAAVGVSVLCGYLFL